MQPVVDWRRKELRRSVRLRFPHSQSIKPSISCVVDVASKSASLRDSNRPDARHISACRGSKTFSSKGGLCMSPSARILSLVNQQSVTACPDRIMSDACGCGCSSCRCTRLLCSLLLEVEVPLYLQTAAGVPVGSTSLVLGPYLLAVLLQVCMWLLGQLSPSCVEYCIQRTGS